MPKRGRSRGSRGLVALAVVALAGCGGGEDESETASTTTDAAADQATTTTTTTTTTAEPDGEGAPPPASSRPVLYFTAGEQFAKRDRAFGADPQPARVVEELLAGPTAGERRNDVRTQIPAGVELERIDVAGGTAAVGVSAEFMAGIPPQASGRDDAQRQELNARLGQLTYTLTQLDGIRAVKVVAGGAAVESAAQRAAYAAPKQGPERLDRPRGAKSPRALEVQERLAELRFLPRRAVDGVYGYRTQQAVMAFQAWNGLARDGVVGPQTTAALRTAKPPRPGSSGPARRIEVYRDRGVALLVTHGRTKRAIHVSTGAAGTPTPAGTYEIFRKELRSWSVPFQVWLPYASYFNNGIAFHEYPDVPAFPASHGCVRVPAPEAKGVYRFADFGTAVVVR